MRYAMELETAKQAAEAAGELALRHFGHVRPETKPDSTVVTAADRECEVAIKKIISSAFPDDAILGEEFGLSKPSSKRTADVLSSATQRKWIIDPIDGTYFFVRNKPSFFVNIALEIDGIVVLGLVFNPPSGTVMYGVKGNNSFIDGKPIKLSRKSGRSATVEYRFWYNFDKKRFLAMIKKLSESVNVRDAGRSMEFMGLALGKMEGIISDAGGPWDIAPYKVIFESAGGRATDFSGKDNIYSKNVVYSNGIVHDAIIKAMGGLLA